MKKRVSMRTGKSKKPTIQDVAEVAGVSTATVSRILNGIPNRASDETVARVRKAVADIGYRPVQVGRSLSTMRSALVALLTPDNRNAFYASIADAIQRTLNATGNAMILCNTREDPGAQDEYIDEMLSHLVSAVVMLGAVDTPGLRRLIDEEYPVVFVNRRCPVGSGGPFVGIDNYAAGREIARYFIQKGYKDCAALHGPLFSTASEERFQGFKQGLREAGIELCKNHIAECELSMESGYERSAHLFESRKIPRAIFCGNDPIAYGVYRRCCELGFRVPDDIALFGFDDNPLNEWLAPWLSTIHVPVAELGEKVGQLVCALLSGRQLEAQMSHVPYRMVIRTSA